MTGPIGEQSAVAQQLINDANKLWVAAGEQSDSADGLGIDGRIGLVHGLVDLWAKSWVAWFDAFIKSGGAIGSGSSKPTTPMPSEVVEVGPRTYPRQIEADGAFVRVGLPKVTIPATAIAFDPPFLPAGLTQFRVVLKDHRFIGSNFTGKIKLTSKPVSTGAGLIDIAPDETVVTVGL